MSEEIDDGWVEGLPTEPGDYWFYRTNPGHMSLSRVTQGHTSKNTSGSLLSVASDFLYESSFNGTTKRVWHKPLILLASPSFDRTCPTCKDAHKWAKERCFDCKGTGEIS